MDNNKKQETNTQEINTEESQKMMKYLMKYLKKASIVIVPLILFVVGMLIDNMAESKELSATLVLTVLGLLMIASWLLSLTSKTLAVIVMVMVLIVAFIKLNDRFPGSFEKAKDLIKEQTLITANNDKKQGSQISDKILDDITNVGSFSDNASLYLYADKPFKIIYSLNGGDFGYATVEHPAGYSTQDFGNGGDLIIEGKNRNDVKIVKESRIKKKK